MPAAWSWHVSEQHLDRKCQASTCTASRGRRLGASQRVCDPWFVVALYAGGFLAAGEASSFKGERRLSSLVSQASSFKGDSYSLSTPRRRETRIGPAHEHRTRRHAGRESRGTRVAVPQDSEWLDEEAAGHAWPRVSCPGLVAWFWLRDTQGRATRLGVAPLASRVCAGGPFAGPGP